MWHVRRADALAGSLRLVGKDCEKKVGEKKKTRRKRWGEGWKELSAKHMF